MKSKSVFFIIYYIIIIIIVYSILLYYTTSILYYTLNISTTNLYTLSTITTIKYVYSKFYRQFSPHFSGEEGVTRKGVTAANCHTKFADGQGRAFR